MGERERQEQGASQWRELRPREIAQGLSDRISSGRSRLWTLVLEARGVPCVSVRKGLDWIILVPGDDLLRAEEELRIFEDKNRFWPPSSPSSSSHDNLLLTLSLLLLLGIFHNLRLMENEFFNLDSRRWLEIGAMHAGKVLSGQWWRMTTSLSLHADWLHLLGNLAAGSLFIGRICQVFGSGWGWGLVLLSGIAGNFVNALLQPYSHLAVGASTAIFGAVGLLSAHAFVSRKKAPTRRRILPVAAGLALLALLGSSGENTDLGAHLWGFTCGFAIGLTARRLEFPARKSHGNALAGSVALFIFLGSWFWAFSAT